MRFPSLLSPHGHEQYSRYLLAVHNPRTSTVSILPTASTPHILTHTVKALKSLPPSAMPSTLLYRDARNALGETFGTKKAKAAIRAVERNKIDVGAMEGVMDFVMEGIDKGAEGLMTQGRAYNSPGFNIFADPLPFKMKRKLPNMPID